MFFLLGIPALISGITSAGATAAATIGTAAAATAVGGATTTAALGTAAAIGTWRRAQVAEARRDRAERRARQLEAEIATLRALLAEGDADEDAAQLDALESELASLRARVVAKGGAA